MAKLRMGPGRVRGGYFLMAVLLLANAICGVAGAQDFAVKVQQQVRKVQADDERGPFHADWDSLARYQTPDWFRDAKFAIFVH